jgi:protein SCO1
MQASFQGMRKTWWMAVWTGWVLAVGCGDFSERGDVDGGDEVVSGLRAFDVRGVVISVEPERRMVRIRHEEIPGYMAAMVMPFEVKDRVELEGLVAGDVVTFRMLVTVDDGWIDTVKRVGHEPVPKAMAGPRQVRMVESLKVGDVVPDYAFTNQFGEAFRLSQFRGKALGVVFFFPRCPYPTFCPRMSANFAEAGKRLGAVGSGVTNWHLLSISFDPGHDTPAVLRAYAEGYGYDPGYWTFATGDMMEIDALTEQLGMEFGRDGEFFSHNARTLIMDPGGRVSQVLTGNTWRAEALAEGMAVAAGRVRGR